MDRTVSASDLAGGLRSGGPLLGLMIKMPALRVVESAGLAGIDLVVLDGEHGPADDQLFDQHLLAARAAGVPALVRVASPDEPLILRVLDAGATGVVIPHVSTAAQAERAVRSVKYPPRGDRSAALTTRAGGHGQRSMAEHVKRSNDETVVIVQVEDPAGVDAVEEIAAVEGVSAVFPGPSDLGLALGVPGDSQAAELIDALERVRRAVVATEGVALCTLVTDAQTAQTAFAGGSTISALAVLDVVIERSLRALGDAVARHPEREKT